MRYCFCVRTVSLTSMFLVGACTSAFQVSEDAKSAGLPFYVKSMIYRQHSNFEYSWLRVSLSTAPVLNNTGGAEKLGARTTVTKDIRDDAASRTALARLQGLVSDFPQSSIDALANSIKDIHAAFDALPALAPDHLKKPLYSELRLAGNYVERVPIVDYTKRYYLNAKAPFFGSSNLAAEVSAEGTLAKGSNAVTGAAQRRSPRSPAPSLALRPLRNS
ncbi:MAG: hypothetical protein ABR543_18640 [Gemmatimonadaceae bacterium]